MGIKPNDLNDRMPLQPGEDLGRPGQETSAALQPSVRSIGTSNEAARRYPEPPSLRHRKNTAPPLSGWKTWPLRRPFPHIRITR